MPQFKIEMELTSVNERILLTDFDSTQSKLEGLTFNETLNEEENDKYTLSFQLTGKSGRAREIPLGKLISIGRPVWLYTTNPDRAIRMVITSYSPVIGSENLVYNIECQDYASYVFARNNVGLTLDTIDDEDFIDWINLFSDITPPPTFTPDPPTFTPDPPTFTPDPPTFTPDPPTFTPDPPTFTPDPPTFTPDPPTFTPDPPTFTPDPPTFTPDPVQLEAPTITQNTRTTTSVSWNILNNSSEEVNLFWDISENSLIEPTLKSAISGNSSVVASATNLNPNTTYYIAAQVKKSGFVDSNISNANWTTLQLTTVTPTTVAVSSTTSSVTFRLTQNDPISATMSWKIRSGSSNGTEVATGTTESTTQNGTRDINITSLNSGTTYWLTDVTATATNKLQSNPGENRSIDTLYPKLINPVIQFINVTSNSMSWTVTNNNNFSVQYAVSGLQTTPPTTTIQGGSIGTGVSSVITFGPVTGLNSSTTYYVGARFTQTPYQDSDFVVQSANTLAAPPPFFPPIFTITPPAPPFFPPNFMEPPPPFFPPVFQSCPTAGTHIPQPDGCICIADGNCGFSSCFCPD